jgi:hypothetical protein
MTTMTRTDIHRPSSVDFDPESYTVYGYADFHEEDGHRPVQIISRLVSEGWSFSNAPHPTGQCSHCGAHLRYAALMGHEPTKTLLWVGETCLDNRFELTAAEFQAMRKAATLNRERTAKADKIAAIVAEHPTLVWASYAYNIGQAGGVAEFDADWNAYTTKRGTTFEEKARCGWEISTLGDIWYKVTRYAEVSEKQVAFVGRLVEKLTEKAEQLVEREAEAEQAAPVVPGRYVIEGEVVSTKWVDNDFGGSLKMLVKHDTGWKVWGTVPSSIDPNKGDRVRFTAAVEPSNDDKSFGFFKRPTKAEVI